MVDFRKKIGAEAAKKPANPIELYETLDRASDKGPLRPAQKEVLESWWSTFQKQKDIILKLPTGEGKTLVGLLILQSALHQASDPVVYLCPNRYLVEQTCQQAQQFGIKVAKAGQSEDLPAEFLNGQRILVTTVQKMFNGYTKFGIGNKSIRVGTVVVDDAHACLEAIRDSVQFRIKKGTNSFGQLMSLFKADLAAQGKGTLLDIQSGDYEALLPVPYWAWQDKLDEVTAILHRAKDEDDSNGFVWPLLKDRLKHCQAFVSGQSIEVSPFKVPIHEFGAFHDANHRVFMSATLANDSVLVKDLDVSVEAIKKPLTTSQEKWSGEKMILIPSFISEGDLDRTSIIAAFAKPNKKRKYGVVGLCASSEKAKVWEANGAELVDTRNISAAIDRLKSQSYETTFVLLNRYDGIDLADDTCRVLILDSRPYARLLADAYEEQCIPSSELTALKTAQRIEQGFGRSVRGEKDYSVLILLGSDLVREVRSNATQKHLSPFTRKQIEISMFIAEDASRELTPDEPAITVLHNLIGQVIKRDEAWKEYYHQEMKSVRPTEETNPRLESYRNEAIAERFLQDGDPTKASSLFQDLANAVQNEAEKGWYLQMLARSEYEHSKVDSAEHQRTAYSKNRYLLRPVNGVNITPVKAINHVRAERIIELCRKQKTYSELKILADDILSRLAFGIHHDKFERALDDLATMIGIARERPDKEWKEGPDNVWAITEQDVIAFECKSEVDIDRKEIFKDEAEQIDQAVGWTKKHYTASNLIGILIIPTRRVPRKLSLAPEVRIMRESGLNKMRKAFGGYVSEFQNCDFDGLTAAKINAFLSAHKLLKENLMKDYCELPHEVP
ncbi:MAG: DEAD/DEAH box helicase family protein [Leptospirales bacterium]|nr:DEAD/DEAH box helicase family protein [Leptospirales bacterium]